MTVDLFSFVGLFDKQLVTAAHLLDKGVAFAVDDAEAMLDWRLVDDMAPLRFQFRIVANFSRNWTARAAGLEPPAEFADDLDVAGTRAAIAAARDWLAALTPQQFARRDDEPLTVTLGTGLTPTLPVAQWLTGFAATNIYFHLSIAYAILRARGVPIGKLDLFAAGL